MTDTDAHREKERVRGKAVVAFPYLHIRLLSMAMDVTGPRALLCLRF